MSIPTGQASTHREQPVHWSLNSAAVSRPWMPASHPVAIPPEYVSPPKTWPPTDWKFAQVFEQAEHRMQYSVSLRSSSSRMASRPLSINTRWNSRSSPVPSTTASGSSKSTVGELIGGVKSEM
jgi:hypothetical protein